MEQKSQDLLEFLRYANAQPPEKDKKIAFLGTEDYRDGLSIAARKLKLSVQALLEKAVDVYVSQNLGVGNSKVAHNPPAYDTSRISDAAKKTQEAIRILRDINADLAAAVAAAGDAALQQLASNVAAHGNAASGSVLEDTEAGKGIAESGGKPPKRPRTGTSGGNPQG